MDVSSRQWAKSHPGIFPIRPGYVSSHNRDVPPKPTSKGCQFRRFRRQQTQQETPESSSGPPSMDQQGRKRHCWECLRRGLVCDSTEPACTRCAGWGIACPGYDGPKPQRLRWLAPGRVTSRAPPRKQRRPKTAAASKSGHALSTDTHILGAGAAADLDLVRVSHRALHVDPWKGRDYAHLIAQAAEYCK
jgi:hypothetical protein